MVASLTATAIANATSPYSIGVAALSSRVKRSSVAFMASLTIRAADIDSGRIKNIQTLTHPRADNERTVSRFDRLLANRRPQRLSRRRDLPWHGFTPSPGTAIFPRPAPDPRRRRTRPPYTAVPRPAAGTPR